MKRIISLFLCSLMLTVLCSCDNGNSVTETKIETLQTKIIDYKTIAPPKDGWTLKLLKDVVYVNGENAEIPFTLNDISDEFEIDKDSISTDDEKVEALLKYENEIIGGITAVSDDKSDFHNVPLDLFAIKPHKTVFDSLLVVNGAKINDSYDELIEKMGTPTEESVNGITKYEYYNCDNYRIGFLISHDENKVSTIRIEKIT